MEQIQRYEPNKLTVGLFPVNWGKYVTHADHLSAMAAKDKEIAEYKRQRDMLLGLDRSKSIAELQEQVRKLREALKRYRDNCHRQGVYCLGYPRCDGGDLIGEPHEPECPRFGDITDDRCELCKSADAALEATK